MTAATSSLDLPPHASLRHIAIIMDGNNRWAKKHHLPGAAGHKRGVERVRDILEACRHTGVEVLTLFAFSSENWNRPVIEVKGLMTLFSIYLKKETAKLKAEGVCIRVIGGRERFSEKLKQQIEWAERETAGGSMTLALAVDYGGRWDIARAAQRLALQVQLGELQPQQINEERLGREMCLADLPSVDLMIRTSGEVRISNFLLWQCAYAEFYFTEQYWPDFDEQELQKAIHEYQARQRRFGLRAEQVEGREPSPEDYPLDATEDDNYYV